MEIESVEEKKVNPSVSYSHPKDVVSDGTLTRDEKVAILREWRYDAVRLQESATENLTGGEPDRLQSVSNALLALGESSAAKRPPGPFCGANHPRLQDQSEAGRIRSIIAPRLADHVRREADKFIDELKRAV